MVKFQTVEESKIEPTVPKIEVPKEIKTRSKSKRNPKVSKALTIEQKHAIAYLINKVEVQYQRRTSKSKYMQKQLKIAKELIYK